jgi:hypothetical protein
LTDGPAAPIAAITASLEAAHPFTIGFPKGQAQAFDYANGVGVFTGIDETPIRSGARNHPGRTIRSGAP